MLSLPRRTTRRAISAFAAMAVSVLVGLTLLGTSSQAIAGYSCVTNTTQIGNSVTLVVVATSGGSNDWCIGNKSIGTSSANISVSGSVNAAQVGTTNGGFFSTVTATPVGLGGAFGVFCTHSGQGGLCTASDSGFINGVDLVRCDVTAPGGLPDPALPLVPVVITTTCTINY